MNGNLRMERAAGVALAAVLVMAGAGAGRAAETPSREKVSPVVRSFAPTEVRLLDGPLQRAAAVNDTYLLGLDADRLLSGHRKESGLEPKAERYGGWEGREVHSHILGHYLTAISLRYAATGDARFKERLDYLIRELAECQKAAGGGRLLGMPGGPRVFREVAEGNIRARGFNLNDCWVPLYTLHKMYAGLRDAYRWGGSAEALVIWRGASDWFGGILDQLTDAQVQRMLDSEHGGMNEVFADLYADTGDARYLALAARLNHRRLLDPMQAKQDRLSGQHANTQIPKVTGLARQYELSGNEAFRAGAEFFWDRVANHRSYVIGGNSDREHFFPVEEFDRHIGEAGHDQAESCNTYNMLKLTRHLYQWSGRADCMDYYERALYNHILSHLGPAPGQFVYFVSQTSGATKKFSKPHDDFWCCVGTGLENPGHFTDAIYAWAEGELRVNLFAASTVQWTAQGVTLKQETAFPESEQVKLTVAAKKPSAWTMRIRRPFWLAGPMVVRVNGKAVEAGAEPGWAVVKRTWADGDTVEVTLPMSLRIESLPGKEDILAVLHGPLVMAAVVEGPAEPPPMFVAETREAVLKALKPVENAAGPVYRAENLMRPRDLVFRPLNRITNERYAVYFPLVTPRDLLAREAAAVAQARLRQEQEARRTDQVEVGFQQSEVDHEFAGEETQTGDFRGRKWRDARGKGWFSYRLKVDAQAPMELGVVYHKGDGEPRRVTVIKVDGREVATQRLEKGRAGEFFDATYPLPPELTQGRTHVTVRFETKDGSIAGGIFGLEARRVEKKP